MHNLLVQFVMFGNSSNCTSSKSLALASRTFKTLVILINHVLHEKVVSSAQTRQILTQVLYAVCVIVAFSFTF